MTVSVNEVVLHEHLEESAGSKSGNHRIELMSIALEIGDRHSFDKTFNEDGITGLLFESLGEVDLLVFHEMFVEGGKIVFLNVEIYLVNESLLKGVLSYWNLI